MNKLDDIKSRYAAAEQRLFNAIMGIEVPPVEPRGPITFEQQRDDMNYLIGEVMRLRAALEHAGRMKTIKGARVVVQGAR
jgi:hypothetical protein